MSSQPLTQGERVVITGMGWVTPLGADLDTVWNKLLAAESGMAPITRFDARSFPTTFAAEVKDYDFSKFVHDVALHTGAALNSQFVLGAAVQAWRAAGAVGLGSRPGACRWSRLAEDTPWVGHVSRFI